MIEDILRPCDGHKVPYKLAYQLFIAGLPAYQRRHWTRHEFSQMLNELGFERGIGNQNITYVVNVSIAQDAKPTKKFVLVGKNRRIKRQP